MNAAEPGRALNDINSIDEAAAYLRIDPKALVRLARQQKIGYLRQGRTLTFPRDVIDTYVSTNVTAASPANPMGLTDSALKRVRG